MSWIVAQKPNMDFETSSCDYKLVQLACHLLCQTAENYTDVAMFLSVASFRHRCRIAQLENCAQFANGLLCVITYNTLQGYKRGLLWQCTTLLKVDVCYSARLIYYTIPLTGIEILLYLDFPKILQLLINL